MTNFDPDEIKKDAIHGDSYYIINAAANPNCSFLSYAARDSKGHCFHIGSHPENTYMWIDRLRVSRNMARSLINVLETWLEKGKTE